jgi:hypothetical protein
MAGRSTGAPCAAGALPGRTSRLATLGRNVSHVCANVDVAKRELGQVTADAEFGVGDRVAPLSAPGPAQGNFLPRPSTQREPPAGRWRGPRDQRE